MKGMARYLSIAAIWLGAASVEAKLGAKVVSKETYDETAAANLPSLVVLQEEKRRLQGLKGYGGTPDTSFVPLGECEGDCDRDEQCEPGLKCFQREAYDAVPGCYGGENFGVGTDFCIRVSPAATPPVPAPQASYQQAAVSGRSGMGLCASDCDRDSDCQGGLICYQRKKGDAAPPQCPGVSTNTQKDYCVYPGGGDPSPAHPESSPTESSPIVPAPAPYAPMVYTGRGFDVCGGDCDHDSDCKNGLICYQRDKGDPIPQGCSGSTNSQRDYCIPANEVGPTRNAETPFTPFTGEFRLKMYWEDGYMWQDEDFERKWCAMRDFDGWPGTGKCWYGLDVLPCNNDHVYIAKCSEDNRQKWQFEFVNDSEAIIKVAGEDRCMMRAGVNIVLRPCNSANQLQRFFAIRGGFEEYRFEISQKSATRYCLNQAHHPKPGEVLAMYPCAQTRSPEHMTSWWEKY